LEGVARMPLKREGALASRALSPDVRAPTLSLGERVEFGLSLDGCEPTSDERHQVRRL